MKKVFVFFLCFSFLTRNIYGQSKILINEFLIDPQPQKVEIINTGSDSADLSGWIIDDSGGSTYFTIPNSTIIYPNSCLVFFGDFNLNKSSPDTIRLINNSETVDSFSYKSSSGSGISYIRLPDGENNWTTAEANIGFFNQDPQTSCIYQPPTPTPSLTPTITLTPTPSPISITPTTSPQPTPTPISYEKIYLSEVMVNPKTGENEWVELYNDNDFEVFLDNWFIDDLENAGSAPRRFSLIIPSRSYKIFNLSSSMFNNDNDQIRLLDFNKNLKDSFEYSFSLEDKTWGRTNFSDDNFCLMDKTPQTKNSNCLQEINNSSIIKKTTPTAKPSTIEKKNNSIQNKIQSSPFFTSQQKNSFYETQPQVLGISTSPTKNQTKKPVLLIKQLTLISFLYSILTIFSVFIKIKFSYGKIEKLFSRVIYSP